jgi:hypothetical protein
MTTYRSQQLSTEAMKVTIENIHEVKKWVGTMLGREGVEVVIPVRVFPLINVVVYIESIYCEFI